MTKKKYDTFNMATGKFEPVKMSNDVLFDELADILSEEARGLIEVFKAEREIVGSILQQHLSTEEIDDRSTD